MDPVYEELDEAKAEIERLKEQYRVKSELAESLRKAHNDQQSKTKEVSSKLEKLTQDLLEKDDAFSIANRNINELKSSLREKESVIKHLTSTLDKLRGDSKQTLHDCEQENKALSFALDEANSKNVDQEKQISALKQEIEGAKRILSDLENKRSDSENKARASREGRENVFFKLEEENMKCEDQLKWSKEQFCHLREAHQKLKEEFRMKEKEWEKDRSRLLDGISSLETKLESQIRISEDFQRRFEMCNQALAHAESKRKLLEAQLAESRESFESVCVEFEEAKSNFESMNSQRDQEIATLRSSLGTNDVLRKEMEYQFRKMEQERQEMLVSLKELQESQIQKSVKVSSSSSKIQNKLKSLEQAHKGCLENLEAKETEWRSQMEKLTEELNLCKSASERKDTYSNELKLKLEASDALIMKLELLNQEISLMLLVLKSELSEAQQRFGDKNSCMDLRKEELEQDISLLVEEMEIKKAALDKVQKDLNEEREKVVLLSRKLQALEELQFPLQKYVERLKEMYNESSTSRLRLEEEMVQIKDDLQEVCDALDEAHEELYMKSCEANEIEFELHKWKSVAEKMKVNLKRNNQIRREVESSLLAQVEYEVSLKQEKESLGRLIEEKDCIIDELQQQLVGLSSSFQNTEGIDTEKSHEFEKESLQHLVEEKDQRICDLQQLVASLEQEFESSSTSFSSKLSRMQEQIKETEALKEMEIQEKIMMITQLEYDLSDLRQSVKHHEKDLSNSENRICEIQAELERKRGEVHKLEHECLKLLSENQKMVNAMSLLSEKFDRLSTGDMQLMQNLGKIIESIEGVRLEESDSEHDPVKENMSFFSSPVTKKVEAIQLQRSPFRAVNN